MFLFFFFFSSIVSKVYHFFFYYRLRFEEEPFTTRNDFILSLNIGLQVISMETKEKLKPFLSWNIPANKWDQERFFSADFERVHDLIPTRKAYIYEGKAYFPQKELISLIMDEFRRWQEKALEVQINFLSFFLVLFLIF